MYKKKRNKSIFLLVAIIILFLAFLSINNIISIESYIRDFLYYPFLNKNDKSCNELNSVFNSSLKKENEELRKLMDITLSLSDVSITNEILMYFRSNNKNSKNISINESIGFDKEGNEITIVDILKMPSPDFAKEIDDRDNLKLLMNYIDVLSDREKEILVKRYGLYNKDEMTQKEIAKELKISRSYVSRIEKRAITKILREFIKNNKISK